jgi:hypothetical protein
MHLPSSPNEIRVGWTSGKTAAPLDTVIITHLGWSPYLETCVRRALKATNRVVLLGDEKNADLGMGEHHLVTDATLQDGIGEFRSAYQHLSRSQRLDFERFCVERWFLIRNFLRRENLDGCLAIDSDVLLFGNVAEDSLRFSEYSMTFGRWDSVRAVPHCNFIRGREAIDDFCSYVMDVYSDSYKLKQLAEINQKKFKSAWISDMSLLASWGASSRFPIGYLENTVADGVGFDSCLDDIGTYVGRRFFPGVLKPWKKLTFRDGIPYATIRSNGLTVPMKCIHYHGGMKILMDRHDRGVAEDWSIAFRMLVRKFAGLRSKFELFSRNYIAPLFRRSREIPRS